MKFPSMRELIAPGAPEISPHELHHWLEAGRPLQLVDARSALEFQQGSLPGAQHAPVTDLPDGLDRLDLKPSAPVIMLCLSGHRSQPGASKPTASKAG
jgi:rhodanese-related sulfurtransferase